MATVEVLLLLAVAAFLGGLAGSYLVIGGGVFLIPFMTLALGIDIKVAIATSLIGVIATSSGAASVYVRDHLTNLRLAMFLEVATTLGAIAGAVVGILVPNVYLYLTFGVVVLYAAASMVRVGERVHLLLAGLGESGPRGHGDHRGVQRDEPRDAVARSLQGRGRSLSLRHLPGGSRDCDGGARTRSVRRGPVITARARLRVVQSRISSRGPPRLTEVEDLNRLIYHILRGGVVVSVAFLLFGFILAGLTGLPIPEQSTPPPSLGPLPVPFTPAW